MKTTYAVWEPPPNSWDGGYTISALEAEQHLKDNGVMDKNAKVVYTFEAESWEEACSIYDGWIETQEPGVVDTPAVSNTFPIREHDDG